MEYIKKRNHNITTTKLNQYHEKFPFDLKLAQIFYLLASISIFGGLLIYLKFILVPLFFSYFLTYLFHPMVRIIMMQPFKKLENKNKNSKELGQCRNIIFSFLQTLSFLKIPKFVAIFIVLGFIISSIIGICITIVYSIEQIQDHFDKYNHQFHLICNEFIQWMKKMGWINDNSRIEWKDILDHLPFENIGNILLFLFKSTLEMLENITLVLFIITFLLIECIDPKSNNDILFETRKKIDAEIWTYIVFKTIISIVVGISIGSTLFLFGIDLAFVFGLSSFILNYIPNIGCFIATSLSIPIILLDSEKTLTTKMLSITIPIFIHFIVGNIIEPLLFGDRNRLHPMAILISLLFWSTVWGFVGAILSVPLLIIIRIGIENINHPLTKKFFCHVIKNSDNDNNNNQNEI